MHHNQSDSTWIDIEKTLCEESNISELPFLSKSVKRHRCFKALTIKSTLTFHEIMETVPAPLDYAPICNNPGFSNNIWVSFSYLVEKYGMTILNIFCPAEKNSLDQL